MSQCRLAGGDLCLSVVDNGVGMTRGDLINNLSSLSRFEDPAVAESLGAAEQGRGGRSEDLLRMGFWSVFFVAHRIAVQVLSQFCLPPACPSAPPSLHCRNLTSHSSPSLLLCSFPSPIYASNACPGFMVKMKNEK